jgi:hypothetical protein
VQRILVCLALAAAACTASTGTDGGADASFDVGAFDVMSEPDVLACGPTAVNGYQPAPLTPTNPPNAGACTEQQASDYAECNVASDTVLCAQSGSGMPGQACRACIETPSTASTWGVVVLTGQSRVYNTEGCVDDALAEVSMEKANGGSGSCGDLLFALYGCETYACTACTGADHDTCTGSSISACMAYNAPVASTSGPCSALLTPDAAPPSVQSCFPNPNIADPTAQEVDWVTRMVGFMCGA